MKHTIKNMFSTFVIITTLLTCAYGLDRQIYPKLNPGCPTCSNNTILIYTQAVGSQDIIHQLWDFTGHVPTIVYAVGSVNSTLTVGWTGDKPDKFVFSEQPVYSFAIAIDRLYEYNDINDTGKFDPSYSQKITSLTDLTWSLVNSTLTDKEAMLVMHGRFERRHMKGFIDIRLDLLPFTAEGTELPHLIHTANSTLIDIRMVNLTTSDHFNSSRFALCFILVSNDSTSDSWNSTLRKSLDDEHTPGVFEIIEIYSPKEIKSGDGGFLEFYPVAYTEPERGVSSSTNAYVSSINSSHIPSEGILRQFYSDTNTRRPLAQEVFLSFGLSGDGFYSQHNFTAWSLTFGYGAPPVERISLIVFIIIVSVCSILVALLLIAVGFIAYRLVRKCRNNGHNYTQCQ